jgi:hypothetical protein
MGSRQFLLALLFTQFGMAGHMSAQGGCPSMPSGGGETIEAYAEKTGSCTISPGSYIRGGTPYRLDIHATTGGTCTTRVWDWHIPACVISGIQNRGVASLRVDIISGPAGPPYPYNAPPTLFPVDGNGQITIQDQDVDSRSPGAIYNNASINWTPIYYGATTLQYKSNINQTPCMMTPSSIVTTMAVNVLKCQPQFTDDNGHVRRLAPQPPGGTIKVYLDQTTMSAATSALDDAISNLNTNQASTGVIFERTGTPCSTPYDGTCISIVTFTMPYCGWAGYNLGEVDPITGYYTGELFLRLQPTWNLYSPTGLLRTFVHELEHYMGLDNYTSAGSCGASDAVMRDNFDCGLTTPLTTLTINDYLPVLNTSYGGGPRNTCGW